MKFRNLTALIAVSAALTACGPSTDSTTSPSLSAGFQAKYEPAGGILPFPNDLYINTKTGQVDLPGSATVTQNGPLLEQNHLDGFGTQSDISVYFTSSIDKSSINSSDVIVLKVASSPAKIIDPSVTPTQLKMGTDFTAEVSPGTDSGGSILTIKPLHPLAHSTVNLTTKKPVPATYLVIVTTGLKDTGGDAATASPDYSKILAADLPVLSGGKMGTTGDATLDQVALFTLPQLVVAATSKVVDPTKIAITFSFTTQYIGVTLGEISANAVAGAGTMAATGLTTHDLNAALPGIADVYAGVVTIPYYLSVPTAKNPTAALTGFWHTASGGDTTVLDPMPKKTSDQTIPVLMSVPNAGSGCVMPVGTGWPVVIFQHGITQNRTNVIAIADGMAQACIAVVAIDLPLHGITDTSTTVATNPFYQNQLFKGTPAAALMTGERTFNMDLQNNTTSATGPDGKVDGSGAWFINLTSTLTSRDNLREAAADLIALTRTLQAGALVGAGFTLDGTKIGFVGHSLGGIVGTTYLAVDPSAFAATLGMPGGHIAELLRNSPEFEPIIDAGLAAQGLVKGTQEYYDFYSQAQAVVEDGDPANYAALAAANHPIHMIEVVGDGTAKNPPDQVVPNIATDVLIAQIGITVPISGAGLNPVAAGVGNSTLAQFTAGNHGSLLEPADSSATQLAITTEMQKEMVSIFATAGAAVAVTDNSHLTTTLKH